MSACQLIFILYSEIFYVLLRALANSHAEASTALADSLLQLLATPQHWRTPPPILALAPLYAAVQTRYRRENEDNHQV